MPNKRRKVKKKQKSPTRVNPSSPSVQDLARSFERPEEEVEYFFFCYCHRSKILKHLEQDLLRKALFLLSLVATGVEIACDRKRSSSNSFKEAGRPVTNSSFMQQDLRRRASSDRKTSSPATSTFKRTEIKIQKALKKSIEELRQQYSSGANTIFINNLLNKLSDKINKDQKIVTLLNKIVQILKKYLKN